MKKFMNHLTTAHSRLLCNQKGASMVEYALLIAAVALAAGGILGATGGAADGTGLMGRIETFVKGIAL